MYSIDHGCARSILNVLELFTVFKKMWREVHINERTFLFYLNNKINNNSFTSWKKNHKFFLLFVGKGSPS